MGCWIAKMQRMKMRKPTKRKTESPLLQWKDTHGTFQKLCPRSNWKLTGESTYCQIKKDDRKMCKLDLKREIIKQKAHFLETKTKPIAATKSQSTGLEVHMNLINVASRLNLNKETTDVFLKSAFLMSELKTKTWKD